MKTGYSKICINPPYGAPICGYYETRLVKGILDNLYVRAVAFDDGETKAVVITLDLCTLAPKYYDAFRTAIVDATGVSRDAIHISLSHSHTSPVVGKDFASELRSSDAYDEFLTTSVRDAAIYAIDDLKESELSFAETEAKGISFVRRYRMKDGSVATNPGVLNENIDHPLGKPNEALKIVKIERECADDILLINFGTHTDSVGGEYISNDYVEKTCDILETALPGTKCMFIMGAQGDVNHVNVAPTPEQTALSVIDFDGVPRGIKHAEYMGRVIAGATLASYSLTRPIVADKISFASKEVSLPSHQENDKLEEARKICELYDAGRAHELPFKEMYLTTAVAEARRIVKLENGPDSFPFLLSALKIGEMVFAGVGGEPFTEIAERVSEGSPFKTTIFTCLTNTLGGYIPTTSAYDEGGYEARSSSLKPGGDDIIVDGMLDLLKSL